MSDRDSIPKGRWKRRVLLPAALLVAGAVAAYLLLVTAPETAPTEKQSAPKIVQVIHPEPGSHPVSVNAFGTVIPARQVTVQPQVGGRVTSQHPNLAPGGRIRAGESLVTIDPADYQLALTEQQANLKDAEYELALELGRQVVAAREWSLLENELASDQVNRALVLREPHLERARAAIDKAKNAIAKAELDLERTTVTAPFDAVVTSESAEVGQLLSTGDTIATLAGTDEFWVQLTLPVADLQFLRFPADDGTSGASATVTLDTAERNTSATSQHATPSWPGHVLRLLGDLDPAGRMARVLVSVADPLDTTTHNTPLLLGSFAEVEIDAGTLDDVIAIPRTALRDGDRLWAVTPENTLELRPTTRRWTDGESLLVDNTLKPGESLVVSNLRVALPGMRVDPQPAPPSALAGTADP